MRLQVKGKNLDVSDSIRSYAEDKLRRLERQLADPTQVELELSLERNPSIAANHVAEATLWTKERNARPRRVYETYGWRADGTTRARDFHGVPVTELRYRIAL